jgi:hypothetical protein
LPQTFRPVSFSALCKRTVPESAPGAIVISRPLRRAPPPPPPCAGRRMPAKEKGKKGRKKKKAEPEPEPEIDGDVRFAVTRVRWFRYPT